MKIMKIDIKQTIKGVDGKEIQSGANTFITLKDICVNSILTPVETDDEKKKFEKYEIWKLLRDAVDEVALTAEQISALKKAIAKFQPQLIMGQCWELLES